MATEPSQAQPLATQVRDNPSAAVQNLKAAVTYLRNHNSVDASFVGALGWCFGGGFSLPLALNEQLKATGIYYGRLVTEPEALSAIDWSVLGVFGSSDTSIPIEQVRAFEGPLTKTALKTKFTSTKACPTPLQTLQGQTMRLKKLPTRGTRRCRSLTGT